MSEPAPQTPAAEASRAPASIAPPAMAPAATPQRRGWLYPLLTFLLMAAVFGMFGFDTYRQDLATLGLFYAIIALGMYVPQVLAGDLSAAYNVYAAIGAYAIAITANHTSIPLLLAMPAGVVAAMLIAAILSLVTRGLTGFHLAIATLVAALAGYRILNDAESLTGGPEGIGSIPSISLLGFELTRSALVGLGLLIVWLLALGLSNMRASLVGLSLRMQRESLIAAESCGVRTELMKTLALSFGAGIATLAGALFALVNQFILPDSFTVELVFLILFIPLLGGAMSPWGTVLGAFVVMGLTEGISFVAGPGALVFGIATLVILLVAPGGLLGWVIAGARWVAARLGLQRLLQLNGVARR